jgi:hypothetical protein
MKAPGSEPMDDGVGPDAGRDELPPSDDAMLRSGKSGDELVRWAL